MLFEPLREAVGIIGEVLALFLGDPAKVRDAAVLAFLLIPLPADATAVLVVSVIAIFATSARGILCVGFLDAGHIVGEFLDGRA